MSQIPKSARAATSYRPKMGWDYPTMPVSPVKKLKKEEKIADEAREGQHVARVPIICEFLNYRRVRAE
jgi:hypothetical protein